MHRYYRCYFLIGDRIKDVAEFLCGYDDVAIVQARRSFACLGAYDGFELWEGARLVYAHPPPRG